MCAAAAASADTDKEVKLRPEDVLADTKPRREYVVPPSANWCNLDFVKFRVWDEANPSHVLLDFWRSPSFLPPPQERPSDSQLLEYNFDTSFFDVTRLAARAEFNMGYRGTDEVIKLPPLRMIERHYMGDTLLESYDFTYGSALLPSTHNVWEFTYNMPKLSPEQVDEIVSHPNLMTSDSFYFIGDELILHHKCHYSFAKGAKTYCP